MSRNRRSSDSRRPPLAKRLGEVPAFLRLLARQMRPVPLRRRGEGKGRAVLVLPGLLMSDAGTWLLRRTLAACGFNPHGWANGVNRGVTPDLFQRLDARLDAVLQASGGPVALVGWSLGGLYARELAKRRRGDVSLVVTLGSPFSVDLYDNNAWRLYEAVNDHPVDRAPVDVDVAAKPPVYTVAIWSRSDGIVAPASASGKAVESDEQVEVDSKHIDLVTDRRVLATLVDIMERRA